MILPSFINNLLHSSLARTSTNGVNATTPSTSGQTNKINNASSYTKVLSSVAAITPNLVNAATPRLNIPMGYQPLVKKLMNTVINTALTEQAPALGKKIDITSPEYRDKLMTDLSAGVVSAIGATAPMYGIPLSKVGNIIQSLSSMTTNAVDTSAAQSITQYDTTSLSALQYDAYGTTASNAFSDSWDNHPEIKELATAKELTGSTTQYDQSAARVLRQSGTPFVPDETTPTSISAGQSGLQSANSNASADDVNSYKVYLVSALNTADLFPFSTQPVIQVQEEAAYSTFSPLHAPGDILSFKNSPARTFTISEVKLISRTPHEAMNNLKYLHMIRGWTKPNFGLSSTVEDASNEAAAIRLPNADSNLEPLSIPLDDDNSGAPNAPLSAAVQADFTAIIQRADEAKAQLNARRAAPHEMAGVIDQLNTTRRANNAALDATQKAIDVATTKQLVDAINKPRPAAPPTLTPITPTATTSQVPLPGSSYSSFGSPPEVLYLYGYSDSGSSATESTQNLRRIPVVITSISFTYPNTVDYIPTTQGVPFPTIMDITITLKETKSPYEMEHFSLNDFRQGKLIGW